MFRIFKRCHQDFNLLHTYHICYASLFWVKSGEKWLTHSVLSPIYHLVKYLNDFVVRGKRDNVVAI